MYKNLTYPFTRAQVRRLQLGEKVLLSGLIFTGRDRLHRHLAQGGRAPVAFNSGAIYHCGPVVVRHRGRWVVRAAGPTTSLREERYMPTIIERHGLTVIIGKGGMGAVTSLACAQHGCVYLQAVGGAAQVLADKIAQVRGVHFLEEFGPTEALWELVVQDFPAIVTMDAQGRSLHQKIARQSARQLRQILSSGRRHS